MIRGRLLPASLLALLLVLTLGIAGCPGGEEETTTTEAVTTTGIDTTTTTSVTDTTTGAMTGPFIVQLTGQEVVPPVETDASGTFTIELSVDETDETTTTLGTTGTTAGVTTTAGAVTTTTAGTGTTPGAMGVSFRWSLEVEDITDVTAAHIHLGQPGENGPVLVPLFTGPPKEGDFSGTLAEGTLSAANIEPVEGMTVEQVIGAIQSGGTYVNVHTEQNPDGEIRGQLIFFGAGAPDATGTTSGTGTTLGVTTTTTG